MKYAWLLPLALAGLLAVGGCKPREQAGAVQEEVARVRIEGQAQMSQVQAEARKESRYQIESAEIEAAYKTDLQRCGAYRGSERSACRERAKSEYIRKLDEAGGYTGGPARKRRPGSAPLLLMC